MSRRVVGPEPYAQVVEEPDDNPAAKPGPASLRSQPVVFGPGAVLFGWLIVLLLIGNIMMNAPMGYTLWTKQKHLGDMIDGGAEMMNALSGERAHVVRTMRNGLGVANRMIRVLGKMDAAAMDRAVASMNSMAESMGDPNVHGTMAAAVDFFSRSSSGIGSAADSANTAFSQVSRILDAFSAAMAAEKTQKNLALPEAGHQ